MNRNKLIFIGAVMVAVTGAMTMVSGYPKLVSPYSFAVVIPALLASELNFHPVILFIFAVLPLVGLYIIWSLVYVRPPYKIGLSQKVISVTLVLLSFAFNVSSYDYGLKYQGATHTHVMYLYNVLAVLLLGVIWALNYRQPTQIKTFSFSVLLFCWLGWVAFPWLGELI